MTRPNDAGGVPKQNTAGRQPEKAQENRLDSAIFPADKQFITEVIGKHALPLSNIEFHLMQKKMPAEIIDEHFTFGGTFILNR